MKKQKIAVLIVLYGVFVFAGCKHEHVWEEANCGKPRHCTECEATEGEVLEHAWESATCTAARTCKTCGTTEGEALGHSFLKATCISAESCVVCGEMRGEPVTHTGEIIGTCHLCGETYNKELVIKLGYRHEVATNVFVTAMTMIMQGATEETRELNALTELNAEADPETVFIGGYSISTITVGEYLSWANDLLRKLYWEDRMEDYTELRAVYEEVYSLCGDYTELCALKEKAKEIVDLIPLEVPGKEERTGEIYDLLLLEISSEEEKEQLLKTVEQWKTDMMEDIMWLSEAETKMGEWKNEYDKVNALFK